MKKNFTNFKSVLVLVLFFSLFFVFVISLYFNRSYFLIFLPVILLVAVVIYYLTNKNMVNLYLKDIKFEFINIKWIDKSDLKQTSFIILIIIFLASLFLWIIDSILTYIVSKFI